MRIEHIAVWVLDLEATRAFYQEFFDASCGEKYVNPVKQFSSYFLSFESGARLEIMHNPSVNKNGLQEATCGFAHFAISLGSKEKVEELTELLKSQGVCVVDGPRTTGDGYYESVVLDPEGNRIELTV